MGTALTLALGLTTLPLAAQNLSIAKKQARTAAAGITSSSANGITTITYNGAAVWKGKTSGKVNARSKAVDGTTYAAAFDGEKVLWENVPGAGAKVK